MASPTPGAGTSTPSDAGDPVVSHALAPLGGGQRPDPKQLRDQMIDEFDKGIVDLRAGRTVLRPEDTHQAIRRVFAVGEAFAAYADAFAAMKKRADQVLEEELCEAVGEQDGIPNQAMNVPNHGDTIRLSPEYTSSRSIDMDQVIWALAEDEAASFVAAGNPALESEDEDHEVIVQFAVSVAKRVVSELYQSAKPKPTGVEALAVTLGHREEDQLASIVRGAIGDRVRKFSKVKVEVKPRKAA